MIDEGRVFDQHIKGYIKLHENNRILLFVKELITQLNSYLIILILKKIMR